MRKLILYLFMIICSISSNCFAGDRELVYCETLNPYNPDAIAYEKVHMDTIKVTMSDHGHPTTSFITERHWFRQDDANKRVVYWLAYIYDEQCRKIWKSSLRWVNYEKQQMSDEREQYPIQSFDNMERAVAYVIINYPRYQQSGTIGDRYRPED